MDDIAISHYLTGALNELRPWGWKLNDTVGDFVLDIEVSHYWSYNNCVRKSMICEAFIYKDTAQVRLRFFDNVEKVSEGYEPINLSSHCEFMKTLKKKLSQFRRRLNKITRSEYYKCPTWVDDNKF